MIAALIRRFGGFDDETVGAPSALRLAAALELERRRGRALASGGSAGVMRRLMVVLAKVQMDVRVVVKGRVRGAFCGAIGRALAARQLRLIGAGRASRSSRPQARRAPPIPAPTWRVAVRGAPRRRRISGGGAVVRRRAARLRAAKRARSSIAARRSTRKTARARPRSAERRRRARSRSRRCCSTGAPTSTRAPSTDRRRSSTPPKRTAPP